MSDTTATMDDYQHQPLPDSTSHIRLIEILHNDKDDRIVCQLTTWPVDTLPAYYAISYTWGEPPNSARIILSDKSFAVRPNCEYMLRQVLATKASKYYWIDAICIDQQTTREKNDQVAMMGDIYSKASHVLACVGPGTKDSDTLFAIMESKQSLLRQIAVLPNPRASFLPGFSVLGTKLELKCTFSCGRATREQLTAVFVAFLARSYFSRVWILQELFLASGVSILCGSKMFSTGDLLAVYELTAYWMRNYSISHGTKISKFFDKFPRQKPWISCRLTWAPAAALKRSWDDEEMHVGCLTFASNRGKSIALSHLLFNLHAFQCTDRRDYIYGTLSLMDKDRYKSLPLPDYKISKIDLAKLVLPLLIMVDLKSLSLNTMRYMSETLYDNFDLATEERAECEAIVEAMWESIQAEARRYSSSAAST